MNDDYHDFAWFYDLVPGCLLGPARRAVLRLARRLPPGAGILDVGCGTGELSRHLAGAGFEVTGVDRSPSMLRQALAKRAGGVQYILNRREMLPFPDDAFDAAVSSFVLHETEQARLDSLLGEVRRVLRPGGCLLVVDYRRPRSTLGRVAHPLVHLPERAAGRRHYMNFRRFMARGALEGLAARHGLRMVVEESLYCGTCMAAAMKFPAGGL